MCCIRSGGSQFPVAGTAIEDIVTVIDYLLRILSKMAFTHRYSTTTAKFN
jgi:hypothetical protein